MQFRGSWLAAVSKRMLFASLLTAFAAVEAAAVVTNAKVADAIAEARSSPTMSVDDLTERLEPLDASTIAALRAALLDDDPFVRQTAVAVLGRVGDPCARLMCRLLKDEAEAVRATAERALIELGPPAVTCLGETLLTEFPSSDAKVRAARALGRIGTPEGIPFLIETLRKFMGGGFRTDLVCESLARIGQPAARALIEHLRFLPIREDVYLALMMSEPAVVRAELLALARDGALPPHERALYATEGEKILGTRALYDDLLAVYKDLSNLPRPTAGNVRQRDELNLAGERQLVLRKRLEGQYHPPMTLEGVRSSFAAGREQEFQRELAEDRRRQAQRLSRSSAEKLATTNKPAPLSDTSIKPDLIGFPGEPYRPSPEALAAGREYQRQQIEQKARNFEGAQEHRNYERMQR